MTSTIGYLSDSWALCSSFRSLGMCHYAYLYAAIKCN